ncbi:MAG: outer membrane protein assembly factor BamD [Candidatus Ratteibacteria bacterium]|nr:outer membrane protein assembly factor BamD [Candidatus Ratteibacteria bacterium]
MGALQKRICLTCIIFTFLTILPPSSFAFWLWTRESGKWVNPKYAAKDTAEEQFCWAAEFFKADNYKRAIDEYRKIPKNFPESPYAARAQLAIGASYYEMNKFDQAFEAYQKVIDNYPHSDFVKEALELEEKLAQNFLEKNSAGRFLTPQHTLYNKAGKIYQQIVDNFPFQSRAPELQYKAGWTYYKAGNFEKAIEACRKLKKNYPESIWAAESSFMIGLIYWEQSPRVLAYHQDAINKAVESFQSFIKNYPENARVKEAKEYLCDLKNRQGEYLFNIGEYYYKNQGSLRAASIYYKKLSENFNATPWGGKAGERLLEIEEIERRIDSVK